MSNDSPHKKNRYPGIRSFEADEQVLFFGRTEEIQELYHLVKVEKLSVLFAKSGIGKSSLIHAGLTPLLKKDDFQSILIRFQDTELSPLEKVYSVLQQHINHKKLQEFSSNNSLWEWVRAIDFEGKRTLILIFDQFEELFNHPFDERIAFAQQLAELVHYYLPDAKQKELQSIPRRQRTPEQLAWYKQPTVKVLLSIRSDRLHHLDEMSHDIPSILNNRFHLKPLSASQAKAAIEKPALLSGEDYHTKPFAYTPKTLQYILSTLSDEKNGNIESFQLQLLCNTIEEKVKIQQSQGKENVVVTPDYLLPKPSMRKAVQFNQKIIEGGIQHILNNYYENKLLELPPNKRDKVRVFLEQGLIELNNAENLAEGGKRVNVDNTRVQNRYEISEVLLQRLLDTRLIRSENTHLGRVYEISHDTLVAPILKSFAQRKAREEEQAHQERLRRERGKLGLAFLVALIAISISSVAIWQYTEARKAKEVAEIHLQKFKIEKEASDRHLQAYKNEKAAKLLWDAKTYEKSETWNLVRRNYEEALALLSDKDSKKDSIRELLKKLPDHE